jgi:ubiquinone/menaquinone biosynthesis C-methylase UbiE
LHTDWDRPFLREAIAFAAYTGKRVLEVGCGIGVDALEWRRAGNRVVAIDLNFPSCQLTKGRFLDAGCVDGRFLNGDAENLPFPDGTFDVIYSFGVLHHSPNTERAIEELHRCLRAGGLAIVMLYHKWSAMVWGEILLGHGVRRGALWKTKSIAELISRYTEWDSQTADNVNPLTRVYSRSQVRRMFDRFADVQIATHYLRAGHFGPLVRFLPAIPGVVKRRLHYAFGWNLIVKAVKRDPREERH